MHAQQLPLALEAPLHFHQDDLLVGKANEAAFALLLQDWPYWRVPITLLVGASGSGKTHMAACWRVKSGALCCHQNNLDMALKPLDNGIPILIEDIAPGEFDETSLFHLLNAVTQAHIKHQASSLLMTSRFSLEDWQVKLADLNSRLRAVQFIEIMPPDDGLLKTVLVKLFADRQLIIEPYLIDYCIARMERSLEAAVRLVAVIDRLTLEKKSKITRGLIQHALNEL